MKRLSLFIIIYTVPFVAVFSQIRRNSVYQTYIDLYKDLAIEEMVRHKIPASITLAQGLLESAAGRSELARKGNKPFWHKMSWLDRASGILR